MAHEYAGQTQGDSNYGGHNQPEDESSASSTSAVPAKVDSNKQDLDSVAKGSPLVSTLLNRVKMSAMREELQNIHLSSKQKAALARAARKVDLEKLYGTNSQYQSVAPYVHRAEDLYGKGVDRARAALKEYAHKEKQAFIGNALGRLGGAVLKNTGRAANAMGMKPGFNKAVRGAQEGLGSIGAAGDVGRNVMGVGGQRLKQTVGAGTAAAGIGLAGAALS